MARITAKKREKAFRLRLERRSLTEISKEIGVSAKTISRWENGWIDGRGRKRLGWKAELEKVWREKAHAELQYGLLVKTERLKAYEELARMAVNRIKECFPNIKAKTAADAKGLISEVRELCKLIARERNEWGAEKQTMVAVKADINLGDLARRYEAAQAIEDAVARGEEVEDREGETEEDDDGDHLEEDA